jgi:signal transduction histidine kinase
MIPQIMEINPPELLDRVTISLEPLLREKSLILEKKVASSSPHRFRTDPSFIRSVLTNLLSNAVKFTDQGGDSR